MSNEIKHISGAAGGYLVGNSHDNGGIQAINKAIGKPLEMEGGEVVITKPAVEDTELREFEGKMLTNRQILSKINESGGGVSFAELGAELPTKIEFCGTEYKYGGETLTDYEIAHRISKCGCNHEENSYADGGETEKRTTAIKTTSLKHYKELLAKGLKAELVTKQDLNKLENGGNLEKDLKENAINVAVNATETLPLMEKGGETSNNEIMELVISPDNNLSKQLVEQTGDYWNAHDFANIDESITDLSFMKPFYHKETGKKFVVIDPSMQPKAEIKTEPSFQPGDKVIFTPKFGGEFVVNYRGDYYGNAIIADKSFGQMEVQYSQLRKDEDKEVSTGSEFEEVGGNYQFKNKFGSFTSVKVMPVDASLKPSNEYFSLGVTVRKKTSNNRIIVQNKPLITMPVKDYKTYMTDLKNRVNQGTENFIKVDEVEEIIETRKPKHNVGDYVSYTSGDIEIEKWQGIVKEVKDFDTEYAYRIDAYTTNVDSPMFDSEKTNERYEVSLKASTKVNFNKAKAAYEWFKDSKDMVNKTYKVTDYKNPYEVNRAIEALLDSKNDNEDFNSNEIEFISHYSGYGGLAKYGEFTQEEITKILSEFFTPEEVVKKMWALAYKYGFGVIENPKVLEPSVGTGNFFKYAPKNAELYANEINRYSKEICEILYPEANVSLQYFEQNFLEKNNSIKNKIQKLQKYDLVIGNPPYGRLGGKFMNMGEDTYTKASTFTEYFILRGLDLLKPGGLLIYIVGAEQYNGGTLFLDSKPNFAKKQIADKAQLIDAYRLPIKIFERTGVSSEIVVFKKN